MKNDKQSRNLILVSLLAIALIVGVPLFRHAQIRNSGPELYEVAFSQTSAALSLIEEGAPVDWVNPEFGNTALHQAAAGGNDAVVSALLAHGAKIDAVAKYGSTPLDYAARGGQPSTVKLLLSKGANPQARNKFGRTPLEDAQGFLRLRHPSAREKVVYPQVVAILQAATRAQS